MAHMGFAEVRSLFLEVPLRRIVALGGLHSCAPAFCELPYPRLSLG